MTNIHPTAIVNPKAQIDSDVEIGPYSIIGSQVKIAKGCKLHAHVVLDGDLTVGENNAFFPFASIGHAPQDLSFQEENTKVEIGNNNTFREYVSIHKGTLKENQITCVGDKNFLMAYTHLAHDVQLGSHCILANSVQLAGHVKVADRVVISGGVMVAPFVSLGKGSYICGTTTVDRNIPPFCMAIGYRAKLKGINIVALRRQNYDKKFVMEIIRFYKTMETANLSPKSFVNQKNLVEKFKNNAVIREMIEFIEVSQVGIADFCP